MPSRPRSHNHKKNKERRARTAWRSSRNQNLTTTQRGYGHAWRKRRAAVLLRDNYLCQQCKRNGLIASANEVDHIRAKALSGTDDEENLEALCRPCHQAKTLAESQQGGGGVSSTDFLK